MEYRKFSQNRYGINSYLLYDPDKKVAAIIDPGFNARDCIDFLEQNNLVLESIFLTHGHGDHIGEIPVLMEKYSPKIYAHIDEKKLLNDAGKNLSSAMGLTVEIEADYYLQDGDKVRVGDFELNVIHTPGHTKGGICFYNDTELFSGDTLFKGSIGRTDLYGGNYEEMMNSLAKLLNLDRNLTVLSGHGSDSRLEREVQTNPFYKGLR